MSIERKKECKFTLKAGSREFVLTAFQSSRGLSNEGKRPDAIVIDCYQEFNQIELLRFIQYLETMAYSMAKKEL